MLLAVVSMAIPSAFSRAFAPDDVVREEQMLNIGIAVTLLLAYGLYLLFSLKTHPEAFASAAVDGEAETEGHGHGGKVWSLQRAIGSLVGASLLAAWMSEILVGAAEGTGKALGMSEVFIGVVFLAIIGGAAESGSAITVARRNRMDLAIGIALGSCIQIALFLAPVLVLASYFISPQPLDLSFSRAELGALGFGVLIGAFVINDGQSNWFKGVQLMTVYAFIAMMFYFIPEITA
jgi:Ca2+:H+ antiporter